MPMNSTGIPTRIEPTRWGAALPLERVIVLLATLLLTIAIISFRPFQPAGAELESGGGDIVNQLGFGTLGALALAALLTLADRRVLSALASPWWLAMLACLAVAVLHSPDPDAAMRAALFTAIGIVVMAAVLALPGTGEAFSNMLALSGFTIVGLCYAGLVLMPDVAIHGAGGYEPQHAGFWRGAFSHKNIAGPVMACLSFVGIYLWRRGRAFSGLLLFALALFFMSNTGSKTTAGTVPLAILMVILPNLFGMRLLVPAFMIVGLAAAALATLGIVFIEPLGHLVAELVPGLTYTGRTTLWAFMGEKLAQHPWLGYGFESFWGTPVVLRSEMPFDSAWDIRGIVHGHNSYLDLAVAMGIPALFLAIVTFVIVPLRDYMRVPRLKENIWLADLFMMIAAFTLFNAFLESFFFRRADPVWLFFVLAVLGLRLVSRLPVPSRTAS